MFFFFFNFYNVYEYIECKYVTNKCKSHIVREFVIVNVSEVGNYKLLRYRIVRADVRILVHRLLPHCWRNRVTGIGLVISYNSTSSEDISLIKFIPIILFSKKCQYFLNCSFFNFQFRRLYSHEKPTVIWTMSFNENTFLIIKHLGMIL